MKLHAFSKRQHVRRQLFHTSTMQPAGTLGDGGDGRTDRRTKGKGGVKVEGVLEETEKIKMKVK